jgi:hypothetical protein
MLCLKEQRRGLMMMTEFQVKVRYISDRGQVVDKKVRKYWYHRDAKFAIRNEKVCPQNANRNYYIEEVLL